MFYEDYHIRNPKGITIEDGVSIGPKVLLDGRKGLHIGKSAVIAYEAVIWTLNHDYNDNNFCAKVHQSRLANMHGYVAVPSYFQESRLARVQ